MAKQQELSMFPTKENNFLGYGSLEAFVRNNLHKLQQKPRKGAFKIAIETENDEITNENDCLVRITSLFFLVKDIRVKNDHIAFYCLDLSKNKNIDNLESDGSHIPPRKNNENMLEYFSRVELDLNGYWVEYFIYQPYCIKMFGKFFYLNNQIIEHVDTSFASKYHHVAYNSKKQLKAIDKENSEKVVSLASRREPHDKPL